MNQIMTYYSVKLFIIVFVLSISMGCSSTKLIQEYKSPDTGIFEANKVLVVGISSDTEIRRSFEKKMVESLEKEKVIGVKSIDFFEQSFTDNKQSLSELSKIESQLLDAGFDAILLSTVIGKESRVNTLDALRNIAMDNRSFKDYYYENQEVYFNDTEQRYEVYITETSLFCICPGKVRELIWQGTIEVLDTESIDAMLKRYTKELFKNLETSEVLILD